MYGLFGTVMTYKILKLDSVELCRFDGPAISIEIKDLHLYKYKYGKIKNAYLPLSNVGVLEQLTIFALTRRIYLFKELLEYKITSSSIKSGLAVEQQTSMVGEIKKMELKLDRLAQRYPELFL